jgi:hypothetical protein
VSSGYTTAAMRAVLLALVVLAGADLAADTPQRTALVRSREAYNAARYDVAIKAAHVALADADIADAARLIIGRAMLERYRADGQASDLADAFENLRAASPPRLDHADRVEWLVGVAQWLFYTERFGAAAEMFEQVLSGARLGGPDAADRALDWWASALDRHAQRTTSVRERAYRRILERMEQELAVNPTSVAANYWTVAAARGAGDVERAWESAIAGWVRAALVPARADALRADLDRLVLTAIIPDRARVLGSPSRDQRQAADTMVTEWERFKEAWTGQ